MAASSSAFVSPSRHLDRHSGSATFPALALKVVAARPSTPTINLWRGPNRDGVWHEAGMIEAFRRGCRFLGAPSGPDSRARSSRKAGSLLPTRS